MPSQDAGSNSAAPGPPSDSSDRQDQEAREAQEAQRAEATGRAPRTEQELAQVRMRKTKQKLNAQDKPAQSTPRTRLFSTTTCSHLSPKLGPFMIQPPGRGPLLTSPKLFCILHPYPCPAYSSRSTAIAPLSTVPEGRPERLSPSLLARPSFTQRVPPHISHTMSCVILKTPPC